TAVTAIGNADVNFAQEVDVLIVGAGISGMLASIDPAVAALNVLIVDQNSAYGGDAIYSAACQMCTTAELTKEERPEKYMTEEGIREKFAPYYEGNEAGLERTVLLQMWGGKFIDKMHYDWGYEFQAIRESPYHQAFFPKGGLCAMYDEFELINEKVIEAGVTYLFETTLKTLITDDTGAIAGGRFASKDGSIVDIKAKSVVLAGGGYVSNQEWMVKYAPEWAFIGNIVSGRKGDTIAAGVAAGGTLSGMKASGNLNPRHEAGHMLGTFYPLIGLLPNGKRFYSETAVHNAATGCLAAGYNEWYSIWDTTAQNGIDQEVIMHAGVAIQTANSIEELAEKMGLALETVQTAFADWDTICDNQADPEFGKTLFLQKLVPPYYFLRNAPVRYKSCGGLTVSDRMEVLDGAGNPIPNLYAAGCTAGTEDIIPAAGSGLLLGSVLAEELV
ncbi:MAG: FAD-binding protein, partial [Actinobacteria bacterium]|nr:FAD-binding protein [Actinomycetota bacterium]